MMIFKTMNDDEYSFMIFERPNPSLMKIKKQLGEKCDESMILYGKVIILYYVKYMGRPISTKAAFFEKDDEQY